MTFFAYLLERIDNDCPPLNPAPSSVSPKYCLGIPKAPKNLFLNESKSASDLISTSPPICEVEIPFYENRWIYKQIMVRR